VCDRGGERLLGPAHYPERLPKPASLQGGELVGADVIVGNVYLTGALELEEVFDPQLITMIARQALTSPSTPLLALLDAFRYNVEPGRAGGRRRVVDVALTDTGEKARLELRHSVLRVGEPAGDASAVLRLPKERFTALAAGESAWTELRADASVLVDGDADAVADFLPCFDLTRRASSRMSGDNAETATGGDRRRHGSTLWERLLRAPVSVTDRRSGSVCCVPRSARDVVIAVVANLSDAASTWHERWYATSVGGDVFRDHQTSRSRSWSGRRVGA
jgi:hypothetical protein